MSQQHSLMKFDPATGEPKPYPSHADQWREWHGKATAWLFNPWTGTRRLACDVGSDPFGYCLPTQDPQQFIPWAPHIDHGQLLDLAMACKIRIDPLENEITYVTKSNLWLDRRKVDCQDFPALAEAVIQAAAEQQIAKEGKP